ncbi:MAG: CCA tRNA nucleotidyltransferase [Hyphomicrobiales bacterium]
MNRLPSLARAGWLKEPELKRIFAAIAAAGGEARVAGGAVRNALLGRAIADIDLATTLAPETVTAACTKAGLKVHPTGIDHGTVTVAAGKRAFEVTTLRHDVESFGRHARVAFTGDWQADALRRDFTVNALYCDEHGKIYDFTDGYKDILKKRIRFVGRPGQRIAEDYLRILRFFRFHAQIGRGAPDKAGLAACIRLRKGLDRLSAERIRQELFKLLAAPGAVATLKLMAKRGILRHILPYTEDWRVLRRLPPDPILRLGAIAAEPGGLKERLRLSNREADRIAALASAPALSPELREAERRALLYGLGAQAWRDAVRLAWARSRAPIDDRGWRRLAGLAERWPVPVFPVTGRDLTGRGMKPGPELGATLRRLEDWWIASGFKPGKDAILARLGQM